MMNVHKQSVRKYMPGSDIFYSYGLTESWTPTGTLRQQGNRGELLLKGPCVVPGYCRREDETKTAFEEGWLRTGYVVREDEDGLLYFVGRWKD